MKYIITAFGILFLGLISQVSACGSVPTVPEGFTCEDGVLVKQLDEIEVIGNECMGIKLNTDFPFIGNCIKTYKAAPTKENENATTPVNVFPKLIEALMNLLMTVILIMSLLMIVVSGILIASSGGDSGKYSDGIKILKKVAVGMALLGASGVILKVINPNFFV